MRKSKMKSIRKFSTKPISTVALILTLSVLSFAKTNASSLPSIKIDNFGQMDERFYRGARPKSEDFKNLAALGIKTVIDLTDNSREREEPAVVAAAMRYVNIPILDRAYPSAAQVSSYLNAANDPATGKVYVQRTGY